VKQLRPIIFNGLSLISLVLCVATVVLWARSRHVARDVTLRRYTIAVFKWDDDVLTLKFIVKRSVSPPPTPPPNASLVIDGDMHLRDDLRFLIQDIGFSRSQTCRGFATADLAQDPEAREIMPTLSVARMVGLPLWFVIAMASLLPTSRAMQIVKQNRARQRANQGLCPIYRYDLRATPDRCPECGTVSANVKA
jgi:hypothetical protein